jgi:hypothetical protein
MQAIDDFINWAKGRTISSARLEQYSGPEHTGGIDVPVNDIEDQIIGCRAEGFRVEWNDEHGHLTLCVIESWEEPLDWTLVKKGKDFVDIEAIMREAVFNKDNS